MTDSRLRAILIQGLALVVFCSLLFGGLTTAWLRMKALGMAYGFGVLARPTGWNVSSVLLQQTPSDPYWWVLVVALANTVLVAALSIVFATIVGFSIGILRHAGNPLLGLLLTLFVETFRNIPLILQLVFWYSAFSNLPTPHQGIELLPAVYLSNQGLTVPSFTADGSAILAALAILAGLASSLWAGMRLVSLSSSGIPAPAWTWKPALFFAWVLVVGFALSAILVGNFPQKQRFAFEGGLTLPIELFTMVFSIVVFSSAYISEVVRGGLQSISKGQWEACHSLGLTQWQSYEYMAVPIAVRNILPSLGNQYVFIIKSTALGITIGFSDLFSVSVESIIQSGQTIEFLVIMMSIYLVLNYSMSTAINILNIKLSIARQR